MEEIISLEGVQIFQQDHLVLSDVNLKIKRGEFVYLIGKTGSGKSSLLRTLYGDLSLKKGEATVSDFSLKNIKTSQIPFLRRKIGIIFQDFQLLTDRSVNENLLFVMKATGWKDKKAMDNRAAEVLKRVGLGNKGYKMPHELSGGEQQRLSIARALINDPELILADEPTGNLDPETSDNIINLLIEISQNGRAVLIATHDHHMIMRYPFRSIECRDGQVIDIPLQFPPSKV